MRRRPMHQPSRKSLGGAFGIPELTPPIRRQIIRVTGEGRQQCHILTFRPLCARIKGSAALSEAAECSAVFYKPGQRRASDAVE